MMCDSRSDDDVSAATRAWQEVATPPVPARRPLGAPALRLGRVLARIETDGDLGAMAATVRKPGESWCAVALPRAAQRSAAVLLPKGGSAMLVALRPRDGTLRTNGKLAMRTGKAALAGPTAPTGPTVLECATNAALDDVAVFDCLVAAGRDVRALPYTARLAAAAAALAGVVSAASGRAPRVLPPGVLGARPGAVLLVREDAPWAARPYPRGDEAALWRESTVGPEQVVLVCRCEKGMARSDEDLLTLAEAGGIEGVPKPPHMSCMVCVRGRRGAWIPLRPAVRSERLSTSSEARIVGEGRAVHRTPGYEALSTHVLAELLKTTTPTPSQGLTPPPPPQIGKKK